MNCEVQVVSSIDTADSLSFLLKIKHLSHLHVGVAVHMAIDTYPIDGTVIEVVRPLHITTGRGTTD